MILSLYALCFLFFSALLWFQIGTLAISFIISFVFLFFYFFMKHRAQNAEQRNAPLSWERHYLRSQNSNYNPLYLTQDVPFYLSFDRLSNNEEAWTMSQSIRELLLPEELSSLLAFAKQYSQKNQNSFLFNLKSFVYNRSTLFFNFLDYIFFWILGLGPKTSIHSPQKKFVGRLHHRIWNKSFKQDQVPLNDLKKQLSDDINLFKAVYKILHLSSSGFAPTAFVLVPKSLFCTKMGVLLFFCGYNREEIFPLQDQIKAPKNIEKSEAYKKNLFTPKKVKTSRQSFNPINLDLA